LGLGQSATNTFALRPSRRLFEFANGTNLLFVIVQRISVLIITKYLEIAGDFSIICSSSFLMIEDKSLSGATE